MFPPTPQDWLPEDDLVYFILDTVATLDLTPIFDHYERELRGQPPFHPRMMVALLLYCYATGTRSSRKIMRRCRTDVACRIMGEKDRAKRTGEKTCSANLADTERNERQAFKRQQFSAAKYEMAYHNHFVLNSLGGNPKSAMPVLLPCFG
jgi:transposase